MMPDAGGFISSMSKRDRFIGILGVIVVLSVFISLVARQTLFEVDESEFFHVALVGPMSGDDMVAGQSLRQGAQLYVDRLNQAGGLLGRQIVLRVMDDKDNADEAVKVAREIAADGRINAVIGHWSGAASLAVSGIYGDAGIPMISPASTEPTVTKGKPWIFSTAADSHEQARFLANYTRNVLGQKLVSIIRDDNASQRAAADEFTAVYKRFRTAIRYTWSFDSSAADADERLKAIAAEVRAKQDAGTIFLAAGEAEAAKLVTYIRDAGARNPFVGTDALATEAFAGALDILSAKADFVKTGAGAKDASFYANGITATSPLLFDTANEKAQGFKNAYIRAYGNSPDWVAAYAYDASDILTTALNDLVTRNAVGDLKSNRRAIRDFLAARVTPETALKGLGGDTYFDSDGEALKPIFIGIYNGRNLISALTQLQPIKVRGTANYISELKKGRVLYVNDRFMYKTNVVYTGIQINEISELNLKDLTYQLNFHIWFRYRGKFKPQNVVFRNAVEPIELKTPAEEQQVGDMTYRLYHVNAKMVLDFTDASRPYGHHAVGLSFSHAGLNKNNLQYVVDVLGLGLASGSTLQDKLEDARSLNPSLGWLIERAWVSQDIVQRGTLGNPTYVGHGTTDPDFSQIDVGVIIKRAEFAVRDFIPPEYFIYLGIFGVLGVVFAIGMDRKEKGRFWHLQSWILRVISWPVLLLAAGNLGLDFAFQNLSVNYIDKIVLSYDILWWLVPARLVGIATERFVWLPLESHTGRKIPNVVRVTISVIIYVMAVFGVIAFVFDEKITSLLATSGLLAMIIGLAIQANISNIFSGIVINLERPFSIKDWVRIGDMEDEGEVVDITWRTTRVRTRNGYVVSIPNGSVSEAEIHNFSSYDAVRVELDLSIETGHSVDDVSEVMMRGLDKVSAVLDDPEKEVRFRGTKTAFGKWFDAYELQFWISDYTAREDIGETVTSKVWAELRGAGLAPVLPSGGSIGPDSVQVSTEKAKA